MDDSLEKFKTQLLLFTTKEQIELINNRIIITGKIKNEQTLWSELYISTLNAMKSNLITKK